MTKQSDGNEKSPWARAFFTMWVGQASSLLGSWLVQFALIWWLTQTTGSATVLATATMAGILPQILIGPFAGTLVDRWNRRTVMIVADALIALTTLCLIILHLMGAMQVWTVYLVMGLRAIGGGFHDPAWQASISLMVPEEHLARIAGLNRTMQGVMNIASPGLGALLLTLLPLSGVLSVDILTAAIAVGILLKISIPQPRRTTEALQASRPSMLIELREGWRYAWAWPGLIAIMLMAMLITFVIDPAFALLPLLVTQHFSGGAPALAGFDAAWGVGVIVGGLVLGAWGGFKKKVVTPLLGIALLGLGSAAFGLLPGTAYFGGVICLLLMGFMNPMINGPMFAIIQARVDPDKQGRVLSLVTTAATAMMPLSLAVAGPLTDWIGIRSWFTIGGLICTVIGLAGFFVPALMHIEEGSASAPVHDLEALSATLPGE